MSSPVPDDPRLRTPRRTDGYAPIAEYAVVGNKRSAAMIAADGAIDWLCLPRFDDPSVFGALLDPDKGGRWTLEPSVPYEIERRYVGTTNVLETTFKAEGGTLRVRDAMTRAASRPIDWNELPRRIECLEGEVPLRWRVEPRFDFKGLEPEIEREPDASVGETGGTAFVFRSGTLSLTLSSWNCGDPQVRDGGVEAEHTLRKGDEALLVLASFDDRPLVFSPRDAVGERVDDTIEFWTGWSSGVTYDGRWSDAVTRSALALELMVCEPDNSMIAAVTSSLPERIGGDKNWDYRYAWVRDTTFAMDSLLRVGFPDSVHGMLTWLLHTARRTHPRVHTFYGLDGQVHDKATELPWSGYRGSTPVRVGNDAGGQLQLGNWGDIMQSTWLFLRDGNRLDEESGRQLAEVTDLLCELWRNEDSCIWELGETKHYTQSKMAAWLCFHRAVQLADDGQIPGDHADRWREEADALREFIDSECFDPKRGAWKRAAGDDGLDAAVLLVAGMDYVEMDDPRLHRTIDAVRDELGAGNGLLYRYTGVDQEEGCFLACSFWLVEALARTDRVDEAIEIMDKLVALGNDVSLFSEEFDPQTGEMLGNFPQALTHLSLISAAFAVERNG
jgi:GH15 family glucan-1,4-alpha-glucosidase